MLKISHQEFQLFMTYIKENYGICIKEEKRELLVGRLYRVIKELNMNSFMEYYKYLLNDTSGSATNLFIDRITTNHTYFMRESSHFEVLIKEVLPYWHKKAWDRDLRTWCAACASGEEAYTIAMVIDEFTKKEKIFWDKKILATDLSRKVLDKAQAGIYKTEEVRKLPTQWQGAYFKKVSSELSAVSMQLKQEVIFRQFNLLTAQYPFKKKFHVIFCRNVMIYFDEETRQAVLSKFFEVLEPGGYLFIGKSESLGTNHRGFDYVYPSIYRRKL